MARSSRPVVVATLAALSGLVVLAGSERDAHAWCRTTTDDQFVPTSAKPCADTGVPLLWSSRCIGFSVQRDASPLQGIDLATTRELVKNAFAQWSGTDCPADPGACDPSDRTGQNPSIGVSDLGPVSCDQAEYNQKSGNANVVTFHDAEWPHADADVTLALTTVTFGQTSGEIFDADIEINSADPKNSRLTVGDTKVVFDLASILTHETGHFLGIAHTQPANTAATMYAQYKQGATFMRDISNDDTCAICAAYPPSRKTICDPTPQRGLALGCFGNDVPDTKKGCACAVVGDGRDGATLAWVAGGLVLAVGIGRRRRMRLRRTPRAS